MSEMSRTYLGSNNPHWKGGRYTSLGYIMIYKPGHPNSNKFGYVSEHRFIMSEILGRPLATEEFVHHKNRNKADNRPENLELMQNNYHSHHHNPRIDMTGRVCSRCGTTKTTRKEGGYKNQGYDVWCYHPITKQLVCFTCYSTVKRRLDRDLLNNKDEDSRNNDKK